MRDDRQVESLIKKLNSSHNFYDRSKIVKALGKTRDQHCVKYILASLKGGSGSGIEYVILKGTVKDALVKIGQSCINEIFPLLLHENSHFQQVVRDALLGMMWKPDNLLEEAYFILAEKGV